jgi:UDP-N-acetylmuramoylalanine--D-glutamate ligase
MVAGMSKSGEACARFLLSRGAKVYIYDDVSTESISAVKERIEKLGGITVTCESFEDTINLCDILVISPGIPIDNPLPVAFRKQGKAIIGEEELGALYLRATAIAVTGTNGKTTTVSMLNEVLQKCGYNSVACGNIGNPLVGETERLTFDDYAVIEISSFQLETLSSLRPHIAVVTNVTEDHLNRHYNMENYIFLKSKILRGLRESEWAVLNYDDEIVRSFAKVTKAKVVYFSMRERVDGAYFENGSIFFKGEKVLDVSDMLISGKHNIYNALACVACAEILSCNRQLTAEGICSFKGIKHRMECVGEVNGIKYIDDSKGTNVDATIQAVKAVTEPTILMLGGKDKGYDYDSLFVAMQESKVIHAVIYGENRFRILNSAIKTGYMNFSLCPDFYSAFRLSVFSAKSGDCVLLSPASSSFDSFSNYEERGDIFKKLVEDMNETTKTD